MGEGGATAGAWCSRAVQPCGRRRGAAAGGAAADPREGLQQTAHLQQELHEQQERQQQHMTATTITTTTVFEEEAMEAEQRARLGAGGCGWRTPGGSPVSDGELLPE